MQAVINQQSHRRRPEQKHSEVVAIPTSAQVCQPDANESQKNKNAVFEEQSEEQFEEHGQASFTFTFKKTEYEPELSVR